MTHDAVLTPGVMELRDGDDILQRCGGPFGGDLVSITQSIDYTHIKMNIYKPRRFGPSARVDSASQSVKCHDICCVVSERSNVHLTLIICSDVSSRPTRNFGFPLHLVRKLVNLCRFCLGPSSERMSRMGCTISVAFGPCGQEARWQPL
jgi:hypothetical protein